MKSENDIPEDVHEFINSLLPDDVGTETIGCWLVRFEGFSGECLADVERRIALPDNHPLSVNSLEDVLDEVDAEFRDALGDSLVSSGVCGSDEEPIIYAIGYVAPEDDATPGLG